jgi:hypothetical protein
VEIIVDLQPHKMFKILSATSAPFMFKTNKNGMKKVDVHNCDKTLNIVYKSIMKYGFYLA